MQCQVDCCVKASSRASNAHGLGIHIYAQLPLKPGPETPRKAVRALKQVMFNNT